MRFESHFDQIECEPRLTGRVGERRPRRRHELQLPILRRRHDRYGDDQEQQHSSTSTGSKEEAGFGAWVVTFLVFARRSLTCRA